MMFIPNTASMRVGSAPVAPQSLSIAETIHCDIVFGSPRDDCRGNGICKIVLTEALPTQSAARTDCRRARAILRLERAGAVSLEFRRTDLCAFLYRHYFRGNHFSLPQACPLPVELLRKIDLNSDALQAGSYPLEITPAGFRVVFRV